MVWAVWGMFQVCGKYPEHLSGLRAVHAGIVLPGLQGTARPRQAGAKVPEREAGDLLYVLAVTCDCAAALHPRSAVRGPFRAGVDTTTHKTRALCPVVHPHSARQRVTTRQPVALSFVVLLRLFCGVCCAATWAVRYCGQDLLAQ